jgi:hypothetical protein
MGDQMYGIFDIFLVFATTDGVNQIRIAQWRGEGIRKSKICERLNTSLYLQKIDVGFP